MSPNQTNRKIFDYVELAVVVDLPEGVANQLSEAVTALSRTVGGSSNQVFWVPPRLAHVALAYTGEVREDLVPLVSEAVQSALTDVAPFRMRARGLVQVTEGEGAEPELVALWVAIEGAQPAVAVGEALKKTLGELDVHHDVLECKPHIPLALLDGFRVSREFAAAYSEWESRDFGEVPVQSVLLKKTNPLGADPRHPFEVLAHFRLKS